MRSREKLYKKRTLLEWRADQTGQSGLIVIVPVLVGLSTSKVSLELCVKVMVPPQ
jgi:hypothetical protein